MSAYPQFPARDRRCLDGLWSFSFENGSPESAPVPGVFDTLPAHIGARGTGTYFRDFSVDTAATYRLTFEGLGVYAEVRVDGALLARHTIPYADLTCDVELAAGNHTLEVLVSNKPDGERTPLFPAVPDFYAYGGIYRSVFIERLPAAPFIERVAVQTVDVAKGIVRLVFNFSKPTDGAIVRVSFDGGEEFEVPGTSAEVSVPGAKPWSLEAPNLHTLRATFNGDSVIERFGIRQISTSSRQIFLNGEPIELRGVNRHEAHPEFGPVQSAQLIAQDILAIKRAGANYIRAVHYQQDPAFLELCDEMGVLLYCESIGWGITAEGLKKVRGDLLEANRRMIARGINNPSIMIWSFLNEAQNQKAEELFTEAVAAIRAQDPTRLVTYCSWLNTPASVANLCDIISTHSYPGWFGLPRGADPATPARDFIPAGLDEIIEHFDKVAPDKVLIISEIGICAIYGCRSEDDSQWTEEFQRDYDAAAVRALEERRSRIAAYTLWVWADTKSYTRGGEIRGKARGFNCAGLVDEYRRPKLALAAVGELWQKK